MAVKGFGHRTTGGNLSAQVKRLKDGSVMKRYNMHSAAGRRNFRVEVAVYKRLKGCSFVPKLLSVDRRLGQLRVSYVGRPPPHRVSAAKKRVIRRKLRSILHTLHKEYGVVRKNNGRPYYKVRIHNNISYDRKRKQLFLLNFGNRSWHLGKR